MSRQIILIAHNLRSTHNVGSLLRTADGLGIETVYLTGYTPYPVMKDDSRLPHLAEKIDRQIHKTALGASKSQSWHHHEDIKTVLSQLRSSGYTIAALEQTPDASELPSAVLPDKIVFVVGREVEGLETAVVDLCDRAYEIPMQGHKESFNVAVAAAQALYQARFF